MQHKKLSELHTWLSYSKCYSKVSGSKPNNRGTTDLFLCIDELLVRAQFCKLFLQNNQTQKSFPDIKEIPGINNSYKITYFKASGQIDRKLFLFSLLMGLLYNYLLLTTLRKKCLRHEMAHIIMSM